MQIGSYQSPYSSPVKFGGLRDKLKAIANEVGVTIADMQNPPKRISAEEAQKMIDEGRNPGEEGYVVEIPKP